MKKNFIINSSFCFKFKNKCSFCCQVPKNIHFYFRNHLGAIEYKKSINIMGLKKEDYVYLKYLSPNKFNKISQFSNSLPGKFNPSYFKNKCKVEFSSIFVCPCARSSWFVPALEFLDVSIIQKRSNKCL